MHMPPPPPSPGTAPSCQITNAMIGRMGEKWTVLAIIMLHQKERRFNELKRAIGGVSQQMLTRTLRALEADGLVKRKVIPTVPPQVEYSLSDLGQSLAVPVMALSGWVVENMAKIEANRDMAKLASSAAQAQSLGDVAAAHSAHARR